MQPNTYDIFNFNFRLVCKPEHVYTFMDTHWETVAFLGAAFHSCYMLFWK